MASIKNLKRDIDNLIFGVISDCFIYQGLHPGNKDDDVSEIITDAAGLRNDLISRVNNPVPGTDPKIIKTHYQGIKADLLKSVDQLCVRLSELSKKKKK